MRIAVLSTVLLAAACGGAPFSSELQGAPDAGMDDRGAITQEPDAGDAAEATTVEAAVEAGAVQSEVLGMNFRFLTELANIHDDEDLAAWLRKTLERELSAEERAAIQKLGWDELMETLKKRLEEQKGRHEGGSKWIGTGGTSPFGNGGYNPR